MAAQPPAQQGQPTYNQTYSLLIQSQDDFVGMVAYALYKKQKSAFCQAILAKNGVPPTKAELKTFHENTILPVTIQGYREQANNLVNVFLDSSLAQQIVLIEEDVKLGALASEFKTLKDEILEKKTFVGWVRDVGSNLAVNFLTIIFIAAAVYGYNHLGKLTSNLENEVGLNSPQNAKPAEQDAKPAEKTLPNNTTNDPTVLIEEK